MTKSQAVIILMRHAIQNCRGAGTGISSIPSGEERKKVKEAIVKMWKQAYPHNPDGVGSFLFNAGF